jgi:hypothetical protein
LRVTSNLTRCIVARECFTTVAAATRPLNMITVTAAIRAPDMMRRTTMDADLVATTSALERTAFRLMLLVLHLGWNKLPAAMRRSPAGEEANRAIWRASDFFNRDYDPARLEEEKARLAGGLFRLAAAGGDPFDLLMVFLHNKRSRGMPDSSAVAARLDIKLVRGEPKPALIATRWFGPSATRALRELLRLAADVIYDGLEELEPARRCLPAVRNGQNALHELSNLVIRDKLDDPPPELEASLERVDRAAQELANRNIHFGDFGLRSGPRLRLVRDDEPA